MVEDRSLTFEEEPEAETRADGKNYLLLIGLDGYTSIAPLQNAVRDTKGVAKVLLSRYQFEEKNTLQLYNEDATRDQIITAFDTFADKITEKDNLLIYYAGHGYYREKLKIGYWVPVDAKDGKFSSFINHSTIRDYMRAIPAHHSFLIVDSCFSGNLLRGRGRDLNPTEVHANKVDRFPSRWCLAAGMIEKVSDGFVGSHSPFAKSLITYLVKNQDQQFPVQDLITHVAKATSYNADQTPIGGVILKTGDENGQFVFRRAMKAASMPAQKDSAEEAWKAATAMNTRTGYRAFIRKYRHSPYFEEAFDRMDLLEGIGTESSKVKKQEILKKQQKQQGPIEMVRVEGGSFQMAEDYTVELSSYEIGKYPITQKEWMDIMGSNPSEFTGADNLPVEMVNRKDIQAFLEKINSKHPGMNYRLPTEAEWEFAARGGTKSKGFEYAGSNDLDEVGWYINYSDMQTHPVGQKRANELGIFDMSGNVNEWCEDRYSKYPSGKHKNPDGPAEGAHYVIRGGNWGSEAGDCRVAFRIGWSPVFGLNLIGFRLARTADL